MARSKQTSAYPSQYLELFKKVHSEGKCIIPHKNPSAFRLNLYGFISALKLEGREEFANAVKLQIQKDPSAVILTLRDHDDDAAAITAALGISTTQANDATEDAINRILGTSINF